VSRPCRLFVAIAARRDAVTSRQNFQLCALAAAAWSRNCCKFMVPGPPLRRARGHDGQVTTARKSGRGSVLAKTGYRRLFAARLSRGGRHRQHPGAGCAGVPADRPGPGVSGAVVAEILPVLLLAPVVGAVVDRPPRLRVMVAADLC
jgi:hypothetical protein